MFCRKRFSIQSIETCLSIKTVVISIKKSFQLCHIRLLLGALSKREGYLDPYMTVRFDQMGRPKIVQSKELIPIILGNLF